MYYNISTNLPSFLSQNIYQLTRLFFAHCPTRKFMREKKTDLAETENNWICEILNTERK